jgi:hypothetical protein
MELEGCNSDKGEGNITGIRPGEILIPLHLHRKVEGSSIPTNPRLPTLRICQVLRMDILANGGEVLLREVHGKIRTLNGILIQFNLIL